MSDQRPPLTTTTSIRPAMIVIAIALGTLLVFLLIDVVTSKHVTPSAPRVAVVGGLAVDSHNKALQACQIPGTPPANISGALLLPVRTTALGSPVHPNSGAGDYDCLMHLRTRAKPGTLLGFYEGRLEAQGWSLFSNGSSHALAQALFQKAGSDTFYWVAGVSITSRSAAGVDWTFQIYQNSSTL